MDNRTFALILAEHGSIVEAELEAKAMEAANRVRQSQGLADSYGEEHFRELAERVSSASYNIQDLARG